MDKERVLQLANLARIGIRDEEAESLSREFDAILGYVGEIKKAGVSHDISIDMPVKNVLRDDADPHESGVYTEAILSQAPEREGDYIKVKKIL